MLTSQEVFSSERKGQTNDQNFNVPTQTGVVSHLEVDINTVHPHSRIAETRGKREIEGLKLTMRLAGQLEPIKVILKDDQYLIVDGICRYHAALELGWDKIKVEILN